MKNNVLDKEYTYIHLIYAHDTKFVKGLLEIFNDEDNNLNKNEHAFIFTNADVYELLKTYPRTFLDDSHMNLIIKYQNRCKWFFSHGMNAKQCAVTPKKFLNKVIYRYWGGSRTTGIKLDIRHPFDYIKNAFKITQMKRVHESFAAIGVTNSVDILDLSRVLNNKTKYFELCYSDKKNSNARQRVRQLENTKKTAKVNVMLGHRGKSESNHIELIKLLARFDSEKFDIYLPLSYGDDTYIKNVISYVNNHNFKNIHIIRDFMKYEDYLLFLNQMDIGIFDGCTSYALGNIAIMLYLSKTIFLNSKGIIAEAFEKEMIPYKKIDKMTEMSTDEFLQLLDYDLSSFHTTLSSKDYSEIVNDWVKICELYN